MEYMMRFLSSMFLFCHGIQILLLLLPLLPLTCSFSIITPHQPPSSSSSSSLLLVSSASRRRKSYYAPSIRIHERLQLKATASNNNNNNDDNDDDDVDNNTNGIGVGIDLGTTNSAIAYLDASTQLLLPTIIPIPNNGRTLPSVVSLLSKNGETNVVVGNEALALPNQYRNVKRILGRGITAAQASHDVVPFLLLQTESPSSSSTTTKSKKTKKKKKKKKKRKPSPQQQQQSLTQQVQEAQEHPALLLQGSNTTLLPAQISAHVLTKLLETAEAYTGQPITRAVIGVPAYFHDAQRQATIEAANLAGLTQVKLLPEPEAAALAYGIGKRQLLSANNKNDDNNLMEDDEELVLVFDLGGGTFDVSMLLVGSGLTEIICTSGDSQLGGSDFDAAVAQHFTTIIKEQHGFSTFTTTISDAILQSAEQVRIYLSNNKRVKLALPLNESGWSCLNHQASDVILPLDYDITNNNNNNGTHVLYEMTRREMEQLCHDIFLKLLRPIREVAIMAGALLPGDTSPNLVQAAMEMMEEEEEEAAVQDTLQFEEFYKQEGNNDQSTATSTSDNEDDIAYETILLQLQSQLDDINLKQSKKAQQRGRKQARDVAKRERQYRQEKRRLQEQTPPSPEEAGEVKVRDGISGRPISRVVLVGGATKMPAIGRLLTALTGKTPEKTVDPDEAVALGCAVHVGVLDGNDDMGTVLNPMQAAILRAVAEQQQKQGLLPSGFDNDFDDDDDKFDSVEYF